MGTKKRIRTLTGIIVILLSQPCFSYDQHPEEARHADVGNELTESSLAILYRDSCKNTLLYLDEEEMCWHPLCNKPDCDHDCWMNEEGLMVSDCDAFVPFLLTGITEWEGRLYYVTAGSGYSRILNSMNLDGTEHKQFRMEPDTANTIYQINRGKLYITYDYLGEKPISFEVRQLNKPEKSRVYFEGNPDSYHSIFSWGKHLVYFNIPKSQNSSSVYEMDEETASLTLLAESVPNGSIYITDNCLYKYNDDVGLIAITYSDGEQETIWSGQKDYDCSFHMYCDGDYFYLQPYDSETFRQEYYDFLLILDMQGNFLENMDLPVLQLEIDIRKEKMAVMKENKEEIPLEDYQALSALTWMLYSYIGATENYIFATDSYYPNLYIEKSKIGSGECEWKRIGYDGEMNETAKTD